MYGLRGLRQFAGQRDAVRGLSSAQSPAVLRMRPIVHPLGRLVGALITDSLVILAITRADQLLLNVRTRGKRAASGAGLVLDKVFRVEPLGPV
jgi:hypothetical protein